MAVTRNLLIGALLPLSVAGCYESDDISVEAVGARYDGSRGICHVEFEVVNNLQEPVELLSIAPVIAGEKPRSGMRTDIRLLNFKIGQSARRTMYYDLDRSDCTDREITDVETGYDCKTQTRICNCVFRNMRPPIPTTCAHPFRAIRPPLTRCREA